ncbi:hypothetical protein ACQ4PT_052203 [Festuca glaucescens]
MMEPVSSPTTHSAMRGIRAEEEVGAPGRTRPGTGLALTTLTSRLWPLVPGLSPSTLMKMGFLSAGFSPPYAAGVDMAAGSSRVRVGFGLRGWLGNPRVGVGTGLECWWKRRRDGRDVL